jgi:hypothetical protein
LPRRSGEGCVRSATRKARTSTSTPLYRRAQRTRRGAGGRASPARRRRHGRPLHAGRQSGARCHANHSDRHGACRRPFWRCPERGSRKLRCRNCRPAGQQEWAAGKLCCRHHRFVNLLHRPVAFRAGHFESTWPAGQQERPRGAASSLDIEVVPASGAVAGLRHPSARPRQAPSRSKT